MLISMYMRKVIDLLCLKFLLLLRRALLLHPSLPRECVQPLRGIVRRDSLLAAAFGIDPLYKIKYINNLRIQKFKSK